MPVLRHEAIPSDKDCQKNSKCYFFYCYRRFHYVSGVEDFTFSDSFNRTKSFSLHLRILYTYEMHWDRLARNFLQIIERACSNRLSPFSYGQLIDSVINPHAVFFFVSGSLYLT